MQQARFLVGDRGSSTASGRCSPRTSTRRTSPSSSRPRSPSATSATASSAARPYMGEPNVKESAGGLRDIHTAMWLASTKFGTRTLRELADKRLITAREQKTTDEALTFLWRVRNELHFLSGHKNDVLSRDIQPQIAKNFGYAGDERLARGREVHARLLPPRAGDPPRVAAADRPLPRDAVPPRHRAAAAAPGGARRRAHRASTSSSTWPSPTGGAFREEPLRLIKVFWHATASASSSGVDVERAIEESLDLVDDAFRARPRCAISSSASAAAGGGSRRPSARCTSWECSAGTCPSGTR